MAAAAAASSGLGFLLNCCCMAATCRQASWISAPPRVPAMQPGTDAHRQGQPAQHHWIRLVGMRPNTPDLAPRCRSTGPERQACCCPQSLPCKAYRRREARLPPPTNRSPSWTEQRDKPFIGLIVIREACCAATHRQKTHVSRKACLPVPAAPLAPPCSAGWPPADRSNH